MCHAKPASVALHQKPPKRPTGKEPFLEMVTLLYPIRRRYERYAKCQLPVAHVHGFADGDCVVLRHKGDVIGMTTPLNAQTRTSTRLGNIAHKNIIGKKIRDVVVSSKGKELRVQAPTIDEYIVMGPRLVTPVRTALPSVHPCAC